MANSTVHEIQSAEAHIMRSYFDAIWDDGISAGTAFDQARQGLIDTYRRRILAIELMPFHVFSNPYIPWATPETMRPSLNLDADQVNDGHGTFNKEAGRG